MLTSVDLIQDSLRENQGSFDCTSMEDPTVVQPTTTAIILQQSSFATQLGQRDSSVTKTEGFRNANRSSTVGRMAIVMQQGRSGGLEEAASFNFLMN